MGGLAWFDKTVHAGMPGANLFHSLWERFGDIWVFPCFSQWWFSHVQLDLFPGGPRVLTPLMTLGQVHLGLPGVLRGFETTVPKDGPMGHEGVYVTYIAMRGLPPDA
jgi:hypothetical protein